MTSSDSPAEGTRDVSAPADSNEAPFDDVITLSTSTDDDGTVTVTVVGEVDTFTAPVLRASLDTQLEQQPTALVIDLCGVQFLGSAGLAVLVETQKSALAPARSPGTGANSGSSARDSVGWSSSAMSGTPSSS